MNLIKKIITMFLPWPLRRRALNRWFGYHIHSSARIGFAWVFPGNLVMKEHSKIDHFTVCVNLASIEMGENASIGRSNWITGFPVISDSIHFSHQQNRKSNLVLGKHSAITKNHHIDCTNTIDIGSFSTIAGYQSQLLTHSIDVHENRQDSKPIKIGDYTFIGTNCVILGGAVLPAHSVLAAKALLNKPFIEEWKVYGGVPAKVLTDISKESKYFSREVGFVY